MQAATHTLLTQVVVLSGLIGGTIEYAEIIKRRAQGRLQLTEGAYYGEVSAPRRPFPRFQILRGFRASTSHSRNELAADFGWAVIGLVAILLIPFAAALQTAARAWRAVRP
jgi:hypothetical protein